MIFKVVRSKYSLKVCKLIKVYKGAFRLENSLDVNIFDYNKSWDNLVGDDKVITTAELILVKFPLSICKKLTKNFILLNRNNFDEYSVMMTLLIKNNLNMKYIMLMNLIQKLYNS